MFGISTCLSELLTVCKTRPIVSIMATRKVEIGPTGDTVRQNIARARNDRRLTLRELAKVLAQSDRPLSYTTLSQIENGARRVDVDDLMAIAVALDVSPASLLVPSGSDDSTVDATGLRGVSAYDLTNFVHGYWSPAGTALDFVVRCHPGDYRRAMTPSVMARANDLVIGLAYRINAAGDVRTVSTFGLDDHGGNEDD